MAATLNRFISWSANKCKPFFLLINKWKGFEWTEECAIVFQQLKDYLARPSIMSSPKPNEVLFAYIAVASYAVSLVLIRVDNGVQWPVYYVSKSLHEAEVRYLPLEKAILAVLLSTRKPDEVLFAYIAVAPYVVSLVLIRVDNGIQRPVYYVSKSLHETEVRYLPMKKAILAVVLGTRKLPHYFQAQIVVILTQLPLKTILRSANYTGRIAKWGTILGAFDPLFDDLWS